MNLGFLSVLLLASFSSFAGSISKKGSHERLDVLCEEFSHENICRHYSIVHTGNTKVEAVARFEAIDFNSHPKDLIKLRQNIKKFKAFPVTEQVFPKDMAINLYNELAEIAWQGAGVGVPLIVLGALSEPLVAQVGAGLIGIAVLISAAPVIADVASMPVRGMIKSLKIRRANKLEKVGIEAIKTLLSPDDVEYSHKRFKETIKAFRSINSRIQTSPIV